MNVTLLELGLYQCRWPVAGERADTLFCGHEQLAGSQYCPSHFRLSIGSGTRAEQMAVR
jgi:GcrA cell cycle regulator